MASEYKKYYEDFSVGDIATYGGKQVTKDEVLEFASEFDPQPFHLDEEAANASLFKGLSSSGWHNCSMLMRMTCDFDLLDTASLGWVEVRECRWRQPVRPGYVLNVMRTCIGAEADANDDGAGIVKFRFEVTNQDGLELYWLENAQRIARRTRGATQ
jgi:acyl dehydratase